MLVCMPGKEQLPEEYLNLVTYPKSRDPNNKRNKDQLKYEVVGKKVANVPARALRPMEKIYKQTVGEHFTVNRDFYKLLGKHTRLAETFLKTSECQIKGCASVSTLC